jgi:indolepyruvate ferredoxin oxidoreductase alpha subunit
MSRDELLLPASESPHFILGNEAIVRGLLESGVGVAATYPGTPSSEVGDALSEIAKSAGIYFEISVNEIVAVEVAAAAAMSGVRSFAFMKHVGMNVASDAVMSTAYTGVRAGMVIMTADDPSMFSSQNEQDNRHYAEMARLPLVEPSSPQEAKDFLVYAFELSERTGSPVILRTTTRVSHMRGLVRFGPRREGPKKGEFRKDPSNILLLPATAYKMKGELVKRTEVLRKEAENSPLNGVAGTGCETGVLTSGAAYNSLMDALETYGVRADVLKLGFSFPFPSDLVAGFLEKHARVIVVEELDPFLEQQVRALAQIRAIGSRIYGKLDGYFPLSYEYNPDRVASGLAKALGFELRPRETIELDVELPPRPPVLCPGCPHRATFYAIELVSKQMKLKTAIYPSDIGCYTLGVEKPFVEADYLLCMGSSLGTSSGFSKTTDQPVVAFIGDSTFFHAGIPGLVNAVHNNHRFVLVVLDNRTTAMTGSQTDPGVPLDGMGRPATEVSIEEVVKAIGVKMVRTVDPFDTRSTMQAVKEAFSAEGVAVLISKQECALLTDSKNRKSGTDVTYAIDQDACTKCLNCVTNFSCPSFYVDVDGLVKINQELCDGCGVCAQPLVCGPRAIKVVPR